MAENAIPLCDVCALLIDFLFRVGSVGRCFGLFLQQFVSLLISVQKGFGGTYVEVIQSCKMVDDFLATFVQELRISAELCQNMADRLRLAVTVNFHATVTVSGFTQENAVLSLLANIDTLEIDECQTQECRGCWMRREWLFG